MGLKYRRTRRASTVAALIGILLAAPLAGCSGTSRSGSDAPGVSLPPNVVSAPGASPQRMSIASASEKDIAAALRANGVEDAEHWSKVVSYNRPYPVDDPSLTKLRQVLAQQHADPATTDRVAGALAP